MKPKISTTAIYAARNGGVRAALPPEASSLCIEENACFAAESPGLCDGRTCWAARLGAKAALGQPRPPIRPERGRTLPRSRSIASISADFWAARNRGTSGHGSTGGTILPTSPRGA